MRGHKLVGWILGVTFLGATHCAPPLADLRTRAAFDLTCASESLQVQPLGGDRTYGVEGCGKRATYVWVPQNNSWILDNRAEAASPAAAPPPVAASAAPPADVKACEAAQDYKRRAANSTGPAQVQLLKMAEKKESECRAQGKGG